MKIHVEREIDLDSLVDNILDYFNDYTAVENAELCLSDFSPQIMAIVFEEMAKVIAKRGNLEDQ